MMIPFLCRRAYLTLFVLVGMTAVSSQDAVSQQPDSQQQAPQQQAPQQQAPQQQASQQQASQRQNAQRQDVQDASLQQSMIFTADDAVLAEVTEMYTRGLDYLVRTQKPDGTWESGTEPGVGPTALALMAFLASGEDPNFGKYRDAIEKSTRSIIRSQDGDTGYMGPSMYHHGFALLALSEAYGAIDESGLWESPRRQNERSIGEALELGVRSAMTSQNNNPLGAWRYSPGARDADTSVSGAVLMGYLAARNAGIEVPDEAIDKALNYFISMTSQDGFVGYAGGLDGFGESMARSAIASLVYSIARRKDLPQSQAVADYMKKNLNQRTGWIEYAHYYQAQALFQTDMDAWQKWNEGLIGRLRSKQRSDGSFTGDLEPAITTSLSLLALALNFRLLPIYER